MTIEIDARVFWAVVSLGALLLLVGVAIVLLVQRIMRRSETSAVDRDEILRRWQRVEQLVAQGGESTLQHAVVEADSVFDLAMKLKFFTGSDFGGRLKTAQARYERLEPIWSAHKLRNRLVHESGTTLTSVEARRAITLFRNGLKELGML